MTCKAFILLTFGHNHSPVQPVSHTETCGLSVVHENCHLSENFHCWCLYFGLHLHPCLLLKTKRPIIRSSCVNSFNYKRSIASICYCSLWAQREIKKKIINRRQMKWLVIKYKQRRIMKRPLLDCTLKVSNWLFMFLKCSRLFSLLWAYQESLLSWQAGALWYFLQQACCQDDRWVGKKDQHGGKVENSKGS